ncbi:hypothetical protein M501DRAFT_1015410 [Patellaria atrata CBS 101060]|uniref:Uncharacterized protein n=1 Tax=Patellaria atrata CBS 101060 TaxID=1346257 RepID=A0A9P4SDA7_9PEZI|nr:hypothetical protein M501DRAFT_1015410 [Patellaria atrata CBS 101060]
MPRLPPNTPNKTTSRPPLGRSFTPTELTRAFSIGEGQHPSSEQYQNEPQRADVDAMGTSKSDYCSNLKDLKSLVDKMPHKYADSFKKHGSTHLETIAAGRYLHVYSVGPGLDESLVLQVLLELNNAQKKWRRDGGAGKYEDMSIIFIADGQGAYERVLSGVQTFHKRNSKVVTKTSGNSNSMTTWEGNGGTCAVLRGTTSLSSSRGTDSGIKKYELSVRNCVKDLNTLLHTLTDAKTGIVYHGNNCLLSLLAAMEHCSFFVRNLKAAHLTCALRITDKAIQPTGAFSFSTTALLFLDIAKKAKVPVLVADETTLGVNLRDPVALPSCKRFWSVLLATDITKPVIGDAMDYVVKSIVQLLAAIRGAKSPKECLNIAKALLKNVGTTVWAKGVKDPLSYSAKTCSLAYAKSHLKALSALLECPLRFQTTTAAFAHLASAFGSHNLESLRAVPVEMRFISGHIEARIAAESSLNVLLPAKFDPEGESKIREELLRVWDLYAIDPANGWLKNEATRRGLEQNMCQAMVMGTRGYGAGIENPVARTWVQVSNAIADEVKRLFANQGLKGWTGGEIKALDDVGRSAYKGEMTTICKATLAAGL